MNKNGLSIIECVMASALVSILFLGLSRWANQPTRLVAKVTRADQERKVERAITLIDKDLRETYMQSLAPSLATSTNTIQWFRRYVPASSTNTATTGVKYLYDQPTSTLWRYEDFDEQDLTATRTIVLNFVTPTFQLDPNPVSAGSQIVVFTLYYAPPGGPLAPPITIRERVAVRG